MKLSDYREQYQKLSVKCNLRGQKALEAVKQDGNALQYVNGAFFDKEDIIEVNGVKYRRIE